MKKEVIETAKNIIGLYNAYADEKMENDIKKVIANPEQYVEEIEYITSMCDTLFDGHDLVETTEQQGLYIETSIAFEDLLCA